MLKIYLLSPVLWYLKTGQFPYCILQSKMNTKILAESFVSFPQVGPNFTVPDGSEYKGETLPDVDV